MAPVQTQNGQPRPRVEFYFSFISLWSYIGSLPFQELIARRNIDVVYKPMDLYQVFAATGGKPPKERSPARQAYRLAEMARWSRMRKIPLNNEPRYYPAQPTLGHRMLLAALSDPAVDEQSIHGFVHSALKAVWADALNIEDEATLIHLAEKNGLNGKGLLAAAADPVLHDKEQALTAEALQRNVFGAPFYIFEGEPFWGQDRLELLEMAIVAAAEKA
ncbi:2-hydroxychromene-2-carboxylate isomerase [Noviherbaspirillum cavernae]|uniref:2-hydroxychromene-2-carboxylate isomerase n=1 Tax=Noviherbaspirillum cavernae TaxID=2320862 RepID=A0A418X5H7_9BURK|nr:2-hydroxychromene-2-carboxylate isomerase [Noviherbaspirillum cavernae]